MTAQPFPISQQLRDEVEQARQEWRRRGREETPEQREALRLVQHDTLTREEIGRVAAAYSIDSDALLELTDNVRKAGAAGGPGR